MASLFVRLRSTTTGEDFAPPELRERIVADVEAQESNMSAVVVSILAKRYKVDYEPKVRRAHPSPGQSELDLNLPVDLDRAITISAAEHGWNRQDEVLSALCDHYDLEFTKGRKRQGPRRMPAAA